MGKTATGTLWVSRDKTTPFDFFQAWIFVPVLTCGAYVNSLNGVLGSLFTSEKKTTTIFKTTCIGSIVNITLNFLLIYLYKLLSLCDFFNHFLAMIDMNYHFYNSVKY